MAKKKDVVPVFVDNVEGVGSEDAGDARGAENLCHLYTGAG